MAESHEQLSPAVDVEKLELPAAAPAHDAVRHDSLIQEKMPHSANDTAATESTQRIPYWLQQAERLLRVIVRIYLGLLVCFAPWYSPAWDANPLFAQAPALLHFVSLGAVRGVISGLGLLNLWIALREAIHPQSDLDS